MHGVQRPGEERAFGYEERGLACGAAAEGEDAVGVGFARVAGDDGVESVGEVSWVEGRVGERGRESGEGKRMGGKRAGEVDGKAGRWTRMGKRIVGRKKGVGKDTVMIHLAPNEGISYP